MAFLTRLRYWLRRPSTAVFPMYMEAGSRHLAIRCWTCDAALWVADVPGTKVNVLNLDRLVRAVDVHREDCW